MRRTRNFSWSINHIYAVALIVSVVCLLFEIALILFTSSTSQANTYEYIQETAQRAKFLIEAYVEEEFDTLMAAAVVAEDRDLLDNDTTLYSLVNGLGKYNAYVLVGFADTSGQAVWVDLYDREHREDLSFEDYVMRALSGENVLGEAQYDLTSELPVNYYAVPVFRGHAHTVDGVLFVAIPQGELQRVAESFLYNGIGAAYIIDEQGANLVMPQNAADTSTGNNIFDVPDPLDEPDRQEILDALAAREVGYLASNSGGNRQLIAYAPLDINDWFVYYTVPESAVSTGMNNVIAGEIAIACIATGAFVFFTFIIHGINSKNRETLGTLAFVDPITGHGNFHKFLLDAQKILSNANGSQYAVIFCDIKNFKYINDMYGRDVGDRMLRYIADLQETTAQEGEVGCRLGEDAFVSLYKYKSKREIDLRFESTAQHVAVFPEIFPSGYKPEVYGGAYVLDAADGDLTLNDMLDRAIEAQEEVKFAGGPKRFNYYSKEMRDQKLWETELEAKMNAALECGEFQVYFQPKIDIQHDNSIFGAEALVRWASPEKGLIPPGRFIELFEKNGFIVELDRFVFEQVCRFYKENVIDGGLPPLVLSVNVSRLGMMRPDFIGAYVQMKDTYGIPDGCIELEFTESLVFHNQTVFKAIVDSCKRNGFLCSMDDFGSGYSSLNILKSIDVDVLKLDRLFFEYGDEIERGQALVKNILSMAKALNMKTVAEGVEKESQVEQLRSMGCDAIQGYVFSKPLPLEKFKKYLRHGP